MGNGRKALAPCGHIGETVIGTYVQCAKCDKTSVPEHVDPEKTEPMALPRCPTCFSLDIEEFEDEIDAAFWAFNNQYSGSCATPRAHEWGCHQCGKTFEKPGRL